VEGICYFQPMDSSSNLGVGFLSKDLGATILGGFSSWFSNYRLIVSCSVSSI